MPDLTPRQTDVLTAIETLTAARGYPPTTAEIAAHVACSPQRVHQHLDALEQRHMVIRAHGKQRTIRSIVSAPLDEVQGQTPPDSPCTIPKTE